MKDERNEEREGHEVNTLFTVGVIVKSKRINKLEFIPIRLDDLLNTKSKQDFFKLVKARCGNNLCKNSIENAYENFINWRDYVNW